MSKVAQPKTYTLKPSWKQFFFGYLAGIVLIPLAGIGLIILYFVRKKQKGVRYVITDTQISSINSRYHRNLDLVNIKGITVRQNWIQETLGIGTLLLQTSASGMNLIGLEHPWRFKELLEKAVAAQQKAREKQRSETRKPDFEPGTMDKMDYLTGLWQQGLISDEDFEKERKHFN